MSVDKRLVDYIKEGLRRGYTIDSLKKAMIEQDCDPVDVEDSIKASTGIKSVLQKIPDVPPPPKIKETPSHPEVPEAPKKKYHFTIDRPKITGFKKPDKRIIILIIIAATAMAAIITLTLFVDFTGPMIKDCGDNQTCFLEAQENCTLAKVRIEQPATIFMTNSGSSYLYEEIKGKENDRCVLYFKIDGLQITNTSNIDSEFLDLLNQIDGSGMTCRIHTGTTKTFEEFMTTMSKDCNGSLLNIYITLHNYLQTMFSKSFEIPIDGADCDSNGIGIMVANTNYQANLRDEDFTLHIVTLPDGTNQTLPLEDIEIQSGGSGLLVDWDCDGTCESDYYTIHLGTMANSVNFRILC